MGICSFRSFFAPENSLDTWRSSILVSLKQNCSRRGAGKGKGRSPGQDSVKLLTLEWRQNEKCKPSEFRTHGTISLTGVWGRGWGAGHLLSLELSKQVMTQEALPDPGNKSQFPHFIGLWFAGLFPVGSDHNYLCLLVECHVLCWILSFARAQLYLYL